MYKIYYQFSKIRVRYAPSPSGNLHLGNLRTVLYNYLFAQKNHGILLLRIQDTNLVQLLIRIKSFPMQLKTFATYFNGLAQLGNKDMPPITNHSVHMFKARDYELVKKKKAYKCFCTQQVSPYPKICLSLTPQEIRKYQQENRPYVIRIVTNQQYYEYEDLVYDKINNKVREDFILRKSNGFPTYHFANVLDDILMGITHVIRGQQWISNTANHLHIYKCLGYKPPKFSHLPLIQQSEGKKLSKSNVSTSIEYYKNNNYCAQALLNYVALLGWYPFVNVKQTQQQMISLSEMVKMVIQDDQFDLTQVKKYPFKINLKKLEKFNKKYWFKKLNQMKQSQCKKYLIEYFPIHEEKINAMDQEMINMIKQIMERYPFNPKKLNYLFETPQPISKIDPQIRDLAITIMEQSTFVSRMQIDKQISLTLYKKKIRNINFYNPIRKVLIGNTDGPQLSLVCLCLGKEQVILRLKNLLQ